MTAGEFKVVRFALPPRRSFLTQTHRRMLGKAIGELVNLAKHEIKDRGSRQIEASSKEISRFRGGFNIHGGHVYS